MSNPGDVARLREIKRLLDRIQQLPHIAASGGNGAYNGLYTGSSEPPVESPAPVVSDAHPAHGLHNGLRAARYESSPADLTPAVVFPPPLDARPRQEDVRRDESRALVPVHQGNAVGISPWLFVTATAVNTVIAAVLAVVITLGVARRDRVAGDGEQVVSSAKADPRDRSKDQAEPAQSRPIELLPIGSPGEPLRLEALKPTRLPLQVRPEDALRENHILVLSGLPANVTLSGATRMGSDSWLLSPGGLKQLEVIVPEWSASLIEVKVELRRINGALAAETKAWLAVPPPPIPQGGKLDQTAISELLQGGDRLLARGDVAAARALYERAAAMGSAQAALVLGSTYDPGRLWSLGVFGMVGNKERARHWYQRADQLGHPDAKERLRTLKDR
jgi:hypothetical protein